MPSLSQVFANGQDQPKFDPNFGFPPDMLKDWRKRIKKHPEANLLQSPEWAAVNSIKGDPGGCIPLGKNSWVMFIIRNAKRGRYLEVPAGPIIDWTDAKEIAQAYVNLIRVAKTSRCGFIRFRPQLEDTEANRLLMEKLQFTPAPMHLGAQNTVMVDLTRSEDEIMASFRRQTRYEVRQALKKGIIVKKSTDLKAFQDFHQVQLETARRQHFVPPDFTELKAEHDVFSKNAVIYSAETADGELICYGLIMKFGLEGDYFEAASTDLGHKYPGAYALQWQVIRDLKAEGYQRYNLFGIAPPDQPNHRYAKVTTFKTGFGEVKNFIPAQDLPLSAVKYKINTFIEGVRKRKRHL